MTQQPPGQPDYGQQPPVQPYGWPPQQPPGTPPQQPPGTPPPGPPTQYQYPAPPPNRPSWFGRHKVLTALLAIVGVLVVGMAGVLVGSQLDSDDEASGDVAAAPASEEPAETNDPTEASEPTATTPAAGPYDFGETYFGRRGNVTVSAPRPYTPTGSAATSRRDERWIVVTITVENISKRVQSGDSWYTEISADGRAGEQTFDSAKVNSDPPDILPGRTGSWDAIFGLPTSKRADVVFSLQYNFFDPIYWQGRA